MNTIDRLAVKELVEHEKTTDLSIMVYLSSIAVSKLSSDSDYPSISNFTVYKLYKAMKDKMDWINESSVYLAFDNLVDMGFFHHDKDNRELLILNSGTGHIPSDEVYKSKGYIRLHHFFFNRKFYRLSLVSKKIVLMATLRISGNVLKPENINFKSKKNPDTFDFYKRILKVNRLAHIKGAIREIKASGLLTISELANNTVQFSLNTISKVLIRGREKLFNFTQEELSKTEKMLKEANKDGAVSFELNHVKEICEVIKDYSMKFGRKVCRELCKSDRSKIRNLLGYTKSIVERLEHSPA